MTGIQRPKGRPKKYSEYERILSDYPAKSMTKRPIYANNIGVFRGKSGDTVHIKIFLRSKGRSIEIPKGKLESWDWALLEAERDRLQGKADRDEPLEDKQIITFKEYATGWLEVAKTRQKSYATSLYSVRKHLIPYFGKKELSDISVREINLWQAKRMGEAKPATVQRDKNLLKAILNTAINEEIIEKNPCKGTHKVKGIEARLRYWTAEEITIVLKAAEKIDPSFKDCILWGLYSGMRRGEIVRMQWTDLLHLPNGEMKIHIPTSKSDKPRQIPCNKHMIAILSRQRMIVDKEQKRIFPIAAKTFQRRMNEIKEMVADQVQDIKFHDLRTLNITNSLLAGVDPRTLIGITGHRDLQMIQKHYTVVLDKAINTASQASGDYIDNMLQAAQLKANNSKAQENNVIVMDIKQY